MQWGALKALQKGTAQPGLFQKDYFGGIVQNQLGKIRVWRMYCASHKRSDGMRQGTGNRVDELNLGDLLDVKTTESEDQLQVKVKGEGANFISEPLGICLLCKIDISRICNISKMILERSGTNFEGEYLLNNYIAQHTWKKNDKTKK